MYYVYALTNPAGRLYIGSTQNLEERVKRHQNRGVRWTSTYSQWKLAYTEAFNTRAEAMRREKILKSGKQNQALRASLTKKDIS
jgi:putative endonuclease